MVLGSINKVFKLSTNILSIYFLLIRINLQYYYKQIFKILFFFSFWDLFSIYRFRYILVIRTLIFDFMLWKCITIKVVGALLILYFFSPIFFFYNDLKFFIPTNQFCRKYQWNSLVQSIEIVEEIFLEFLIFTKYV